MVNPNSGPGSDPLPGHDYVREVPRLNSFPNVHTIGYVRVNYCNKPLAESCAEIERYAGWNRCHDIPGLYVKGIYVDETPNHQSDERTQYLDDLRNYIKDNDGLLGERMVSCRRFGPFPYPCFSPVEPRPPPPKPLACVRIPRSEKGHFF